MSIIQNKLAISALGQPSSAQNASHAVEGFAEKDLAPYYGRTHKHTNNLVNHDYCDVWWW